MYETGFFWEACNTVAFIKLLHYRSFSGKFATVSQNCHKNCFSLSLILLKPEIPGLLACNVKEKGVVSHKDLFEIFEILEHSFFPKHFQNSICSRVSNPVGCRLWSYKFIKTKLSYVRFSGKFPKFSVQLFRNTLMKTWNCDGVY